jgi:hypothetical protein
MLDEEAEKMQTISSKIKYSVIGTELLRLSINDMNDK